MGVYAFQVASHLRPAIAFVGAHGATDLASWRWPPIYAACCLLPLPSWVVTGLFVASSLVHFAEDFSPGGSLALHSLAGLAWLLLGAQRGLEVMLTYLTLLHTPAHYLRCWRRRRWAALGLAAVSTLVGTIVLRHASVVVVGDVVQRVVVAHVCTELSIQCETSQ
jgi:hypothetical protein